MDSVTGAIDNNKARVSHPVTPAPHASAATGSSPPAAGGQHVSSVGALRHEAVSLTPRLRYSPPAVLHTPQDYSLPLVGAPTEQEVIEAREAAFEQVGAALAFRSLLLLALSAASVVCRLHCLQLYIVCSSTRSGL